MSYFRRALEALILMALIAGMIAYAIVYGAGVAAAADNPYTYQSFVQLCFIDPKHKDAQGQVLHECHVATSADVYRSKSECEAVSARAAHDLGAIYSLQYRKLVITTDWTCEPARSA